MFLSHCLSFFLSFQFQEEQTKNSTDSMNSSKCMLLCFPPSNLWSHTMKWNAIETFPVQGLHGSFHHCIHICCTPRSTHTHADKKRQQHSKVSGEKLFNYSRHESTNVWETQPYRGCASSNNLDENLVCVWKTGLAPWQTRRKEMQWKKCNRIEKQ